MVSLISQHCYNDNGVSISTFFNFKYSLKKQLYSGLRTDSGTYGYVIGTDECFVSALQTFKGAVYWIIAEVIVLPKKPF